MCNKWSFKTTASVPNSQTIKTIYKCHFMWVFFSFFTELLFLLSSILLLFLFLFSQIQLQVALFMFIDNNNVWKNRFFIFLFKLVPIQQKYNVKRTTYTSTNDYSLILFNFICFDQLLLCKFFFSLDKINNKNEALNKISSNSMESQKKKLDTRQVNMDTFFKWSFFLYFSGQTFFFWIWHRF